MLTLPPRISAAPTPAAARATIAAFVAELEAFRRRGHDFLFPGTQREAFDAYLDGLKDGHWEGYFEIPTGVGKTALFLAIIGCYLEATEGRPAAPRVLIHEPSNDLVVQTARACADFLPDLARTIEAEDGRGRVLDFDRSEVELHYSGRKGARNGHKVLITTYQSQAADERKPEGRPRTFRPEDFGLVIHDEAHCLTGRKFGPAAVDKFRGALQLGVTATPEYSDDRTVAHKLAHRYYHLPLNAAIGRGDLCHVRPILIQTHLRGDDRINLERARRFLERRHGRPLTPRQLEQLLNQKARNQAVIKAYLTGTHPDTGAPFLGQTGMIFAGGVAHCDDFVRHAEDVLGQPKYRPIRRWLAEEGLALIAPIHSAVPTPGIEITLGGARRRCTKDEIKELHRRGKVLLIISDQELRLGTDFPMDSFVADLVDRFSVVDAVQRMGRGFRVDRGDPDKSCAALNVIDETTHAIYAGTPHYPIHAIEILHGAVHRPPTRRPGAMTSRRFRQNPPEVTESVEELGFELVSRVEALRAAARAFREGKKAPLPEKDEHWLSSRDMERLPGGGRAAVRAAVAAILAAYDAAAAGEQAVAYHGESIRVQKMQSGRMQPICIRRADWPRVEIAAGVSPGAVLAAKDEHWLSMPEIDHLPGARRREIKAAARALLAAYDKDAGGEQEVPYRGRVIRLRQLQSGTQQPVCIRRADWPAVERAAGVSPGGTLPAKDEHWLSAAEIEDIPGGRRRAVQDTVREILGTYDKVAAGEQEVIAHGQAIRVQQLQSGTQQPVCIRRADWPRVEIAAGVGSPPAAEGPQAPPAAGEDITPGGASTGRAGTPNSGDSAAAAR